MSASNRAIGGNNNKRGNRYEDHFATYKLLRAISLYSDTPDDVRMKEQAGCVVDDFLSVELGRYTYHQLKADVDITWGTGNNKLAREFAEQKAICEQAGESFQLVVVVNTESRRDSLTRNMPDGIADVTDVLLFPEVRRTSHLVSFQEIADYLRDACALRHPHNETKRNILESIRVAWQEHEADPEGFCVLSNILRDLKRWGIPLIRCPWEPTNWWHEAENILNGIENLEYWTDSGYFEYKYGNDKGVSRHPCDTEGFEKFARRIINVRPTTFNEFEEQL